MAPEEKSRAVASAPAEQSAPMADEGPDVVDVLWWYRLPIIAVAIGAALVAYVASLLLPSVYEARTSLLLGSNRAASAFLNSDSSGGSAERFLQNQARLIDSQVVLQQVTDELDGPLTVGDLRQQVEVEAGEDSDVVTIVAQARTLRDAVQIASGAATAYQDAVREDVESTAESAVASLERDREQLRGRLDTIADELTADPGNDFLNYEQDATTAQLFSLQEQIEQIRVEASLYGLGARVIEPASSDVGLVQPRPLRNSALGFALGATIAATIAWFWTDRSSRATAPVAPYRRPPGDTTAIDMNGTAPGAAPPVPAENESDESARHGLT